jgi:hypothetical protein
VTGTGFPADTDVVVVQCATGDPLPDNCDLNSVQFLTTDGAGAVATDFVVSRKLITGIGDEFDCAVPGDCEMAVSDLDVTTFAAAPITFDPNAPLAKPLAFIATIANDGVAFEKEGVVLLHGQLICNRGAFIEIDGRLQQAFGRFLFRTDFSVFKQCPSKGTFDYSFFVEPDNGLYAAGPATVKYSAFGIAGSTIFSFPETTHGVTLSAASEPTAAMKAAVKQFAGPRAPVEQGKAARAPQSGKHW